MNVQTAEIFLKQKQHKLSIKAKVQGLREITEDIASWVATQPVREGMLTIYIRHTSASILIQENFDADVERDIETFFHKLVPEELDLYTHIAEGEDDMPAHIKGALTQTSAIFHSVKDDDAGYYRGFIWRTREFAIDWCYTLSDNSI